MNSLEHCRACVADYVAHMEASRSVAIGDTVPAWRRRQCEDPDCALYDAILARLETGHMGQLAGMLRRTRERIMSKRMPRPASSGKQVDTMYTRPEPDEEEL